MARDKGFHDYVMLDILGDIPGVSSRGMFGGYGIYKDGKMFGLISGSELYIKINKEQIDEFKEMDSRQFSYKRQGKEIKLGYWFVPEEVLEDRSRIENLVFKILRSSTS